MKINNINGFEDFYFEEIQEEKNAQFQDFTASYLYCFNCKNSFPVKERLLLVLPDGYLYEYFCPNCGEVLGDRKVNLKKEDRLLF